MTSSTGKYGDGISKGERVEAEGRVKTRDHFRNSTKGKGSVATVVSMK